MTRVLAGFAAFLGIFTLPWVAVFFAVIFFGSVFSWYIEAVFIGFLAALVSDATWWKFFLPFCLAFIFQERLKKSVNYEKKFIASLWIWAAGLLAFWPVFFALI